MGLSRRAVLKTGFAAATIALSKSSAGALARPISQEPPEPVGRDQKPLPAAFDSLKPLGKRVRPITVEEFQGRMAQAQRLMREAQPPLSALYLTPGTSFYYYTGIRWGLSERLLAVMVPQQGDALLVCPAFEESRLRELLRWRMEVRAWQEDQSPYALLAQWLSEKRIRTARIGVEETTRFVFFDGLRKAAPALEYTSADPVSIGCRARKSEHELELMRLACAATLDVYRAVFASLREGMSPEEVGSLVSRGFARMGLRGDALVLFGASAALPHGTQKPQKIVEGQVVLIDGGTSVEGYQSDVTRCSLLGKPPAKLTQAFEIVRKAQDAALRAATPPNPCGSADDAARGIITGAGYGPGYKYFTHRVGHGIGLDGHEWPYLVRGNSRRLEPGMTFSNEPGIYIPGEFGLRLEDDMVIAETGPAHLLTPGFSPSLEKPID